jgi:hypothetical protein
MPRPGERVYCTAMRSLWWAAIAALLCLGAAMPRSELTLWVSEGTSVDADSARSVTVTCDPDGGTHPDAAAACELLRSVDGRVEQIPPAERACTKIYKPVTVRAAGTWRGEPREFQRTFGNQCEADAATGDLFAF